MRIRGGVMPGGICFSTVCEIDVTCAVAVRMSTPGWKNILTMPTPGHGLAFDMVDIVDGRGKLALVIIDHPARHVVGRQAAIGPHHRDHRNVDVRKNVGRRLGRPPARRR